MYESLMRQKFFELLKDYVRKMLSTANIAVKKRCCGRFVLILLCAFMLNSGLAVSKDSLAARPSVKSLRSMARVYMAYGEYAKACPLAEQALSLAKAQAVDADISSCLVDLAYLYKHLGRLSQAQKLCLQGLAMQEETYFKSHPLIAYTLRTLSSIYLEQNKPAQARQALSRAMDIMLESHAIDDQVIASFKVDMAKVLVAEGDFAGAQKYYEESLMLINKSYGPDHLYTATVLVNIAELYVLQHKYQKAESLIDHALVIQQKIYGRRYHLIVPAWLTKAKIFQAKGAYSQAADFLDKALNAVEKTGNTNAIEKFVRQIEKIRTNRQVAYLPTAKVAE